MSRWVRVTNREYANFLVKNGAEIVHATVGGHPVQVAMEQRTPIGNRNPYDPKQVSLEELRRAAMPHVDNVLDLLERDDAAFYFQDDYLLHHMAEQEFAKEPRNEND